MRITATLLAFFCALILNANAIKNGDFSEGLKYWMRDTDQVKLSETVKAGNKPAVCILPRTELRQVVTIDPDATYELSFLVKGENINAANPGKNGARIMLNAGSVWDRVTANADNRCMTGSFDWQRVVYRFEGSKFKSNKLRIKLVLDTDGKCYFADLKLTEVGTKAPAPKVSDTARGKYFRESYLADYPLAAFYPTDKSYGFVEPGQSANFCLQFKEMPGLEYSITVKNDLGKVVYTVPRKPYTANTLITIPGQERGYYIVEATAFIQNQPIAMIQSAFVSTPAIKGKRDPFFQITQFGIIADLIDGYRMLGAGSVVLPIISFEKGDHMQNARKRYLHGYKNFLNSDFDVHALYVGGQHGLNRQSEHFVKGYPMYNDAYFKEVELSVTAAATVLKGKIKSLGSIYEMPSHANMRHKHCGTWSEALSQQLFTARVVSRAARKIDPTLKISAGGNNVQMYIEPMERIVMNDLADEFDIYNIDAYFGNWNLTNGNPSIPEKSLRSFYLESSRLAQSLGKTPLVQNTETGYAIYYGDRYDRGLAHTQAALTTRALIISKSAPVSSVALFRIATSYGGKFVDPLEVCMTSCWKPIRSGSKLYHTPLPGGAAYATCARELKFVKFYKEIKTGDNIVYAYIFTRPDGKTLLCPWMVEGTMTLKLDLAQTARHVSMFGRETDIPAGQYDLVLSQIPCYIILDEAPESVANQIEKLLTGSRPLYKAGAKLIAPDQAMVYVANTGNTKSYCTIAGQTLELFPGSISNIAVPYKPGSKTIPVAIQGTKQVIEAEVISDTVKFTRVTSAPVFDGSGQYLTGRKMQKLTVPTHVKPAEALQPERGFFKSSMTPDNHNISAEYFLGYDDKNIYIAVKVDDPVHQQRYKNQNLWRDDCVQFVFAKTAVPPADARLFTTDIKEYNKGQNYGVALTARGTEFVRYGVPYKPQLKSLVTRRGNITFYEIAVPWSELKSKPGDLLYFSFVVPNNDKKSQTNAPYWLDMADGVCGNRDDALLPLVIFE
ncbi:MAG: hypothetical protein E7047_04825 [Lentisphaerae bacterium]|nr:hypothetical protein [Lentisphaerota bacterium]